MPFLSGYNSSATFTPAASSHTAGDCNGAAQEFTKVVPLGGGTVFITGAQMSVRNASAEVTGWRVHLYSATPVSAIADDAAWSYADADVGIYLGYVDIGSGTSTDSGANQWTELPNQNKQITLPSTVSSLFGYLVNDTTVTTAAAAHAVTLLLLPA